MSETEPVSWEPSDKKALRSPHPYPGIKGLGNRQARHFSQMHWGWRGEGAGGEWRVTWFSCSGRIDPSTPGHRLVGRLEPHSSI